MVDAADRSVQVASLLLRIVPLALGVAASPLPVVAVLIILISRRAKPGSIVMAISWVAGNLLLITLSLVFAETLQTPRQGPDLPSEGIFTLLLGVGLVVMGVMARRGRRLAPDHSDPPAWVSSVDNLSPLGAGLVAFSNATTSPKNLALTITAGQIISRSGIPDIEMTIPALIYVAVASITVVGPVVVYFVGGSKSVEILSRWRDKVTANAAAVMEITLFVLGVGLSLKGLYNLLS